MDNAEQPAIEENPENENQNPEQPANEEELGADVVRKASETWSAKDPSQPASETDAAAPPKGEGEEDWEQDEDDIYSLLSDEEDTVEQHCMYRQYLNLLRDINVQNEVIADLKARLVEVCNKECKTCCDHDNIEHIKGCLLVEHFKLETMITKAMELQNFGSKRRYKFIPIETTINEDNFNGC